MRYESCASPSSFTLSAGATCSAHPRAPEQVVFTPLLMAYVSVVCVAAMAVAELSRPTVIDPLTLIAGCLATAGMAAFAVCTTSGVDVAWSASIFVHLGMTLALGSSGSIAAALAHGLVGGWFV
jgi:hypothetical protein